MRSRNWRQCCDLKSQLQGEPELAFGRLRRRDLAIAIRVDDCRLSYHPRRRRDIRARVIKRWRVGQVKDLSAELHGEPFGQFEVAEEARIHIENAGAAHRVAPGVAETFLSNGHESVGFEVALAGPDLTQNLDF